MSRPVWALVGGAIGVLVLIVLVAIYAHSSPATQGVGPAVLAGSPAQDFSLPNIAGRATSLRDFRGRLIVLNLWASWCPPCRAELPDLQRLYAGLHGQNLIVVGVNEGESPERARAFAVALGIHFPILIDEDQSYGRVYAALGLPTTIIIDRGGKIVRGFDGALTFGQMQAAVVPLLKNMPR